MLHVTVMQKMINELVSFFMQISFRLSLINNGWREFTASKRKCRCILPFFRCVYTTPASRSFQISSDL